LGKRGKRKMEGLTKMADGKEVVESADEKVVDD
jgi:hypothetical protein